MYEDDETYAAKRLNNTLVRLQNGNPFFVVRTFFDENGVLSHRGENFVTEQTETVLHSELNLEPVPLGFINIGKAMVFVARKPMRRDWKQGLSHNSIITFGHIRPDELNMRTLLQPIIKQYPSFARAKEIINRTNSVAFSREFGLERADDSILLKYRQHKVGVIKGGIPVLDNTKTFLQQHLDEVM